MVTGVECAGLALAVIPLIIEAAKAYSDGIETVRNVATKSRWKEDLEDFYTGLLIQLYNLDATLKHVRTAVSRAGATGQHISPPIEQFPEWHNDSELERRLTAYFGSETSFHLFTVLSRNILVLLHRLVMHRAHRMIKDDQSFEAVYQKLQALVKDKDTTKSSFFERFTFYKNEEKRKKHMSKLQNYIEELEKLTNGVETRSMRNTESLRKPDWKPSDYAGKLAPSVALRTLFVDLHAVFEKHFPCPCAEAHDIKLCLKDTYKSSRLKPLLEIDFLLSGGFDSGTLQHSKWQEGNITVITESLRNTTNHTALERLCQAFQNDFRDYSVTLFVENNQEQRLLKQGGFHPRRLRFMDSIDPISLQTLLGGSTKLGPSEKRTLALIFAESLLIYHDSNWLSRGWNKEDICFFYRSEDEPDISHPFLTADFNGSATGVSPYGDGVYHRNPNILALGILLVEIFNEAPIEKWRKSGGQKTKAQARTVIEDWETASRVVKKMDPSPSTTAIEACLDLAWIPAGYHTSLNDPDVRAGLFEHVIIPLKQELDLISGTKLFRPGYR